MLGHLSVQKKEGGKIKRARARASERRQRDRGRAREREEGEGGKEFNPFVSCRY